MSETNENTISNAVRLVESGVMIAIAVILSMIKIVDLPYGGSVTIACVLPIIIISYRHGIKWGLLSGLVFGIIQQLLGLNTLSYVTTWQSVLAVILLDYIIAFMVMGLGGVFRRLLPEPAALLWGAVFVCVLRYICHVISGATVWAGLSIPTNAALLYSLGYNATYMVPETVVTAAVAYFVGSILDFSKNPIGPVKKPQSSRFSVGTIVCGLVLVAAFVFDIAAVFSRLQNADTGEFDITGLSSVSWAAVVTVTVIAIVIAAVVKAVTAKSEKA